MKLNAEWDADVNFRGTDSLWVNHRKFKYRYIYIYMKGYGNLSFRSVKGSLRAYRETFSFKRYYVKGKGADLGAV